MTGFEIGTLFFVGVGQTIGVLTYIQSQRAAIQSQRAAAQSFKNEASIRNVHDLVNGQTEKLIETNTLLATAQGDAAGRANSTLELAAAAKIVIDDAKSRGS